MIFSAGLRPGWIVFQGKIGASEIIEKIGASQRYFKVALRFETTISIVIDKGVNRIMACIHEDLLRRGLDKSGADIACRRANKLGIVDGSFSFDE